MSIGTLLLTCEHGGNRVPRAYARLFAGRRARQALAGHRGYDIGALGVARALARALDAPLYAATVTRLLVELNRSLRHRGLISEFAQSLDPAARDAVIERYYLPHRARVNAAIDACAPGLVCHVGVHSFTPIFRGERRTADIGLLYDPKRPHEARIAAAWKQALLDLDPLLRVRRNYPYLGTADGFTTALRRRFAPGRYAGIELETNQSLLIGDPRVRRRLTTTLTRSLAIVLEDYA